MATLGREAARPDPGPDIGYELLDAGDGRRLERFGTRVVDRPAPGATWPRCADYLTWRRADLRFDPGSGWFGEPEFLEPWPVSIDGLTLELRPVASGGLGLYPEHLANLAWVAGRVRERAAGDSEPPGVLNLFAHTGLVTLGAALGGAAVAHVDASKGTVDWARRNAVLSGVADKPIRWLVDDALGFVEREARRGRRYDGIVLDPPSFGRAGRRQWKLVDELPALLDACHRVAADDAFVLLTAHTTGLEGDELRASLEAAAGRGSGTASGVRGPAELERLVIEATSGAELELGWAVRSRGR